MVTTHASDCRTIRFQPKVSGNAWLPSGFALKGGRSARWLEGFLQLNSCGLPSYYD
jgi:hypothetical protein